MDTQTIRISTTAYQYLKEKSIQDKKSMLDTLDFVIEIFRQVNTKIIFLQPSKQGGYMTCRKAFYEQNKHLLEKCQREYFEDSPERLSEFIEKNKAKFQVFKIAYLQQRKADKKEHLKKYNRQYYLKYKNV